MWKWLRIPHSIRIGSIVIFCSQKKSNIIFANINIKKNIFCLFFKFLNHELRFAAFTRINIRYKINVVTVTNFNLYHRDPPHYQFWHSNGILSTAGIIFLCGFPCLTLVKQGKSTTLNTTWGNLEPPNEKRIKKIQINYIRMHLISFL